jgi:hypothetical protein
VNKLVKGFKDEAEKNHQNTIPVNNVFVKWWLMFFLSRRTLWQKKFSLNIISLMNIFHLLHCFLATLSHLLDIETLVCTKWSFELKCIIFKLKVQKTLDKTWRQKKLKNVFLIVGKRPFILVTISNWVPPFKRFFNQSI